MEEARAVLVTGASTGIGRKITEHLAAAGHFVFAGARKDADLRVLGTIENVQALRLDVTAGEEIAAAVQTVKRSGRTLHGIVNNAGVATFGPIANGVDTELDLVMAVNVQGVYRVTRAFMPLVAAAKGRVVTIGSVSGILARKNVSVYSMSKHAIEAFTDSLAEEVQPLGVDVSVIEPGAFNTELGKNLMKRIGADPELPDLSKCKGPDNVAHAVALALFEPQPKRRYLIAHHEDEAHRTIKKQIEQLVQLNEGHPYTYNRDALVRMLDEALVRSRPRTDLCGV